MASFSQYALYPSDRSIQLKQLKYMNTEFIENGKEYMDGWFEKIFMNGWVAPQIGGFKFENVIFNLVFNTGMPAMISFQWVGLIKLLKNWESKSF